ncbi:type VI secretion system contractile sheath domain-containing protein, partial [Rubrivirga sp.]|uniref:type VI secretion system contractile sheath domain-containing protein n=1 Tax=Rubrivirga sp. TaxID=1885344 RepID=UPI003C723EF8
MSESPSVGFTITSDPDTTSVAAPAHRASERETGGAFRLFLVSDLDPQGVVEDWTEGERSWDVDANTFADRMREHGPRLEVAVGDEGNRQALAWTADALDAFTPAGIAQRVPTLASVAQAHAALEDAAGGKIDLEALRTRLQESGVAQADALADAVVATSSSRKAPEDDGSLDALLGMISIDGDDSPSENPLVGSLVEAASGSGPSIDRDSARRLAEDLGGRLRGTIATLVEDDDVRRAEAAWRGLKMLIGRLDIRKGARLSVLAAPKSVLAEAVHYQILLPEYDHGTSRTPLAAILLDHEVVATSNDLNMLGDLAASGASLQVPVVASAAPAFFGLEAPTDFSKLPPATALLQQQPYARFQSLRQRPEAAQLALAVPPFLLRPAYGKDHVDKAFGLSGGERLWGGAALLAGMAMAEAHKSRGWPMAGGGQAVPDLEVRTTRMGAMPLAASFSDGVLDDLARAGILG